MISDDSTRFTKSSVKRKNVRQRLLECLEDRCLLAVASLPDQRLRINESSVVLVAGNFQGAKSDLVSVSRNGRIDLAVNNNANGWQPLSTFASGVTEVLGGTSGLLVSGRFERGHSWALQKGPFLLNEKVP